MITRLITIAAFVIGGAYAQESLTHEIATDAKPWTSNTPKVGAKDFHFVVVSDNSGRPRPGIYREAMEKAELLQPAFVISVGDMIDGRTGEDEASYEKIEEQWDDFMTVIEPLSMPFIFVPGNHDVGKGIRLRSWEERFGPMHYHFLYRDVLFIVLDSTNYSDEQVEWVGEVLDDHPNVRWTFYIQHHPHWLTSISKWGPIWKHLENRERLTILGGHIHTYFQAERGNIQHITLATTGGSSQLRGEHYGEFDHLLWVTVTDDGPVMANVALDGILPTDYRTLELAAAFRKFNEGRAITAETVTLPSDTFESAEWNVEIENPWNQPLRVKGLVEASEGILPSPSGFTIVVPPHGKATQPILVRAEESIPLEDWQPLPLHWQAIYDTDNAAPIQFSDVTRLHWDGTHTSRRTKDIEVDGDLDEWGVLPYRVLQPGDILDNEATWRGIHDGTFSFGVAHDDEFVYMAIRTTDDQLETEGIGVLQDFGRALFRALGDDPSEARASRDDVLSVVDGVNITPRERSRHERYRKLTNSGSDMGARYATTQIEKGFQYEFAIPRSALEEASGKSTTYVQVNAAINDHDSADARLGMSLMMWRPHWAYGGNDQTQLGVFHLE